jgi:hypothetical protein
MLRLEDAEARYEALRERDRVVASLQSKQRMLTVFEHLLDDPAREALEARLWAALDHVRDEAKKLALELARAALVELEVEDLGRAGARLRAIEAWLEAEPSARLDCCHDLLTFVRDLRETRGAPRRPPALE